MAIETFRPEPPAAVATAGAYPGREGAEDYLNRIPMAVVTLDWQGRIRGWNEQAEQLFGWAAPEILGCDFGALFEDGTPPYPAGEAWLGQAIGLLKNGLKLDVRLLVMPRPPWDRGAGAVAFVSDISEVTLDRGLTRHLFQGLAELLRGEEAGATLQCLCESLAATLRAELVWIGTPEPHGRIRTEPRAGPAASCLEGWELPWLSPEAEDPISLALRTRLPRRCRVTDFPPEWREDLERAQVVRSVILPLMSRDAVEGVLVIGYGHPQEISDGLYARLQALAEQISLVLLLAREQEQLRLRGIAMESVASAIFITSREGNITWVNEAFTRLSGYPAEEVIGRSPRFLASGSQPQALWEVFWETILSGRTWRGEVVNRTRDGRIYVVDQTVTPILDAAGEVSHFVAIHEDITARKEAELKVEHLAHYDSLTGLPNRTFFRDRLDVALAQARRSGSRVCLLFMDLDHFKAVNDTFGHDFGDVLLKAVAARASTSIREGDTLARLGGDEFTVVLPAVDGPAAGARVADRLLGLLSEPLNLNGREIFITPSIGISVFPDDASDSETLIKNADTAMYRAKEGGRNGYQFFTADMNAEMQRRYLVEQGLRRALESGELELFYQPQIELTSGIVVALEALLRWRHPELGLLAPGEFIGIAEETGLVVPIGEWVLLAACRQNAEWQRQGLPVVPVAVNVSTRQFLGRRLADTVRSVLAESGLCASLLELELTESVLMQKLDEATKLMEQFRALGIRMAIDDFGTGYSSLNYLARFPIDTLKIDRSFVSRITSDERDRSVVRTIVAMGKALHLNVVAEGVDCREVVEFLRSEGCHLGQGYFWTKPVPAADVPELLERGCLALP